LGATVGICAFATYRLGLTLSGHLSVQVEAMVGKCKAGPRISDGEVQGGVGGNRPCKKDRRGALGGDTALSTGQVGFLEKRWPSSHKPEGVDHAELAFLAPKDASHEHYPLGAGGPCRHEEPVGRHHSL